MFIHLGGCHEHPSDPPCGHRRSLEVGGLELGSMGCFIQLNVIHIV